MDQIEMITSKVAPFVENAEAIFAATATSSFTPPYDCKQNELEKLFAVPEVAQLETLILGDEHHEYVGNAIAASPQLDCLKTLWLRNNQKRCPTSTKSI